MFKNGRVLMFSNQYRDYDVKSKLQKNCRLSTLCNTYYERLVAMDFLGACSGWLYHQVSQKRPTR